MCDPASYLLFRPSIQFLCPPIPGDDATLRIAYKDGIMRQFNQFCLQAQLLCLLLSFSLDTFLLCDISANHDRPDNPSTCITNRSSCHTSKLDFTIAFLYQHLKWSIRCKPFAPQNPPHWPLLWRQDLSLNVSDLHPGKTLQERKT